MKGWHLRTWEMATCKIKCFGRQFLHVKNQIIQETNPGALTCPSICHLCKRFSRLHCVKTLCREQTRHLWYTNAFTHKHTHACTQTSRCWLIGREGWLSERWMDKTMKINMYMCVCVRKKDIQFSRVYDRWRPVKWGRSMDKIMRAKTVVYVSCS